MRKFFKLMPAVVFCLLCAAPAAATDFELTDTQGRSHALKAYQGKWVLLNLWATWCAPCIKEMPELDAIGKVHGNLVVLGLAVDGQSPARVTQFADKLGVGYPIIAGNEKIAQQFKPRAFPTTILYDPTGRQVLVKEGIVTRAEIERVIGVR